MKKQIKKLLCAALSLTMIAGSVVLPTMANADDETTLKSWKFDFGSADNTATGYTAVPADTKYTAALGYGFVGLENGFAVDEREDGWSMTQGYDLELENGARETVTTADDDFVATTTRTEKEQDYNSPIRFTVKVEKNTYYKVKVHLVRADVTKEAKVSLFTEKRHQHLLDEPIPAEGMDYETSVYVHNNWSKNTYEYVDTQLSIAAAGDNVAISSIEIEQTNQGKTFWILGDSTVCQQGAAIPYWPLDHCQGVGSAMAKYVSKDWAIVNEAESGLDARSSTNHFNNMINDVKEGDVVWFEFGHNDDKVTTDPSTNGYLTTLENYYTQITQKGASLIVASPIQRCTAGQYSDGTWSASLAQYGTAASEFVETQIAAGKTNIAYIDLNTASLDVLNEIQDEIDAQREAKSLETLGDQTLRFYYYTSKYAGYDNKERTHPNDYGADNFAKAAIDEAKTTIQTASTDDATASQKTQANVLKLIFDDTRTYEVSKVAAEVVQAGAAPNSYYPSQLAKVVLYDYPLIVNSVTFNEDNTPAKLSAKMVASNLTFTYGVAVIEIFDKNGQSKGTVKSSVPYFDASSTSETQEVTFNSSTVTFDSAAGDTFKAYVKLINADSFEEENTVISTTYTQNDMIDVKEYLLQGAIGTENKEDFSTYNLADGETLVGKGEWKNPGGETFVFKQEDDVTYAHCVTTGGATYYPEKSFTAVSSGKLYCRMDVRYISGTFNLYFTDGTALNNWPAGRIMPVKITQADGEVKVYLDGTAVATINSGEWVTFALTIDLDYGTYSLSLNGQTYTADFAAYQSNEAILTPSKLSLIAFQNDKSSNEYDVTNIVLATLNTDTLPNKTITVASEDETKGTVEIEPIPTVAATVAPTAEVTAAPTEEVTAPTTEVTTAPTTEVTAAPTTEVTVAPTTEVTAPTTEVTTAPTTAVTTEPTATTGATEQSGTTEQSGATKSGILAESTSEISASAPMNTIVTVVATAKEGYQFDNWTDETGKVISYSEKYSLRLHDDVKLTANFVELKEDKYDYLYHEDFKKLTSSTVDWSKTNTAPTIEADSNDAIENYLKIVPNSTSGNRSTFKAFPTEAQVSSGQYIFTCDIKMTPSNDRPTQFAVTSATEESKNGYYTDNYVFTLTLSKASSNIDVNAGEITDSANSNTDGTTSGYTKGTWAHIHALMDFDAKTVTLKITSLDGATTYLSGTYDMKATKLGSMQVTAGRGASEVDIDNIEVFSADQYVEPTAEPTVEPTATPTTPTAAPTDAPTLEPTEPTTEPTVAPTAEPLTDKLEITGIDADGKTVNISSTSNEKTAVLIGALYDGGKLVEVSTNGDLQSGKLEFVNDVNSYDIKVFAWDSLAGMKPQYLAAERKKPTSEVQTLSVIKEFPELDAEETETVE